MAAETNWKSQVGFSARLNTVSSIVSAHQRANPSSEFSEAHADATKIEADAFEHALSQDEYQAKCQGYIDELESQEFQASVISAPPVSLETASETERQSNPFGIQIGPYENAVHTADGLFSTIYKSITGTGDVIALKLTTPHMMSPPHDSEREARILRRLSDINVIRLIDAFNEPGGYFVLVFPFMPLHFDELLRKDVLSARHIRSHLKDLFQALAYIHSLGIIHRDVKPSNILLQSATGPAYLADFGIAWSPNDESSEDANQKITDVGTTCYRPPEILFGDRSYGTSFDLWAAGCVVAEAVDPNRRQLFDSGPVGSELALIQSIFTSLGTPNTDIWPSCKDLPDWGKMEFRKYPAKSWEEILEGSSSNGRDLTSQLVRYESGQRLSAEKALSHPYFTHGNP